MKTSEFLRLIYGTMMGTSTQYIKSSRSHLFPFKRIDLDEQVVVFIGGSCNTVYFAGQNVLVNPGEGKAAHFVHQQLSSEFDLDEVVVVCTQSLGNFSLGTTLYKDAGQVLSGSELKHDARAKIIEHPVALGNDLKIEVFNNCYTRRDLAVSYKENSIYVAGGLLYNNIHPPLVAPELHVTRWIEALKTIRGTTVIPGEGDLTTSSQAENLVKYLTALRDDKVAFSECRQRFDWQEIIGTTSLEENFDLIRHNEETHSEL